MAFEEPRFEKLPAEEKAEEKEEKPERVEESEDKERKGWEEEKEGEIKKTAEEKYRKRLEGKEPGHTWEEIDEMLQEKGITPGSREAKDFMEKWDWGQAEKEWRKKKEEKWEESLGTRGKERIREAEEELAKEKKAVESAEIPKKGMETEEILKEVGIEKPAESFEEIEERRKEKLKETRVRGGEKLSEAEEIERNRDFYLKELGYSLEYKGLLRGKARVLDAEGKYVVDEKGEPREFKAFFKLKKERTPLIDFLKEELQSKFEKKTEEVPTEKTEEEKLETGFQKAVKTAEQEQARRAEKISSLQDVKKIGKERLEKVMNGLSYVAALDKLGILGLKEGKKLAVEGGKDLAAIGLTPAATVEEAGRYIAGRIQIGEALRKSIIMREKAQLLEKVPVDKRPEYYNDLMETVVKAGSEQASEELIRGYDKIYKKGKILRLIEILGGKLSRPIGRTFGPSSPPKPERI